MNEGNTIPFIARYRKEITGELDEEQLRQVEERYRYLLELNQRKQEVIRLIDEQGKLTDELRTKIERANNYRRLKICISLFAQREEPVRSGKRKGLRAAGEGNVGEPRSPPNTGAGARIRE